MLFQVMFKKMIEFTNFFLLNNKIKFLTNKKNKN